MKLKILFFLAGIVVVFLLDSCSAKTKLSEREISFNHNWKFIREDVPNAESPGFDDSAWRTVDVPHDYSIEDLPEKEGVKQIGPFSEESVGGPSTGHVVGGIGWYRKHFFLDEEDSNKIIKVLFDGVYMNADFWINGHHLGNHPFGYTAFAYDLTDHLNPPGQQNILAVQVKNLGENSRWYSGSGIYRNVKLIKTAPVYIDLWGNFITTPDVSAEKAVVNIESKVVNTTSENESVTVRIDVLDPEGELVQISETEIEITAKDNNTGSQEIEIENPQLWSVEDPNLYTAVIMVQQNGTITDQVKEKFGIRSIVFSAEKGFLLNGKNILLKGGCLHHDNGILGAAAFERAEYRKVKRMKDYGYNAIRTAHNPPSEALLDACDELGMLVMNESFDQWQKPKKEKDYNLYFDEWWERDLESMVLRDRNHPSIIIWSIGNEIKERADSSGLAIAQMLKEKVKSLDNTRPVTQAVCSFWDNPKLTWEDTEPIFDQMDVHGYNYQWEQYEPDHEKFPERVMIGTESLPLEAFENWQIVEKLSYVIGDFVWTGMDYFGESGIGSTKLDNEDISFLPPWPWFNAYCGDVSILGYKKPQLYYRDVIWGNSDLEMLVHAPIPEGREEVISKWGWPEEWKNWNLPAEKAGWKAGEGHPLQVSVYTSCDQVRLELNGEEIDTKDVSHETKLIAKFEVPYQQGELTAIGLKDGKEIVRQTLKTAGKPAQLRILAERENIAASSDDLAYFNVDVLDENGLLVPTAEIPVEFDIQGNCKLQAVGNGNPTDMKSFQQPRVNTFRGKCQLIVRSCEKGEGIKVTAISDGLESGTSTVKVVKM